MNAPMSPIDRDLLAEALAAANLPTLVTVLYQLTGDRRWLRPPYRPTPSRGVDLNDGGGFDEVVAGEIRAAAAGAVLQWAAGHPAAIEYPTDEQFGEMISLCVGEDVAPEYWPMMRTQMRFAPGSSSVHPRPPAGFRVAIVGAGISGMLAAIRLGEAGIDHVVIEKAPSVGGVWLQNRYPGAGVDTPSELYSYSFFERNWSVHFARREEVLGYLDDLADEFALHDVTEFDTEVVRADYDPARHRWQLQLADPDGRTRTMECNVLISAVGIFGEPHVPDLPGIEDYAGRAFHSADWPDDVDVAGRHVAVVGTGASAMQIVPAIADDVRHLDVFQRTAQWISPVPHYFTPITAPVHYLCDHVPFYRQWNRARLSWTFNDKVHSSLILDPEWPHVDRSMNAVNDRNRESFVRYIERSLHDRPDLQAKSLPSYPPYGKRILLDNGWYAAIKKPNVELVTEGISGFHRDGVVTTSGAQYRADVVVLCTGFKTQRYLGTFDVHGRDGTSLREHWADDDASAYLGVAVANFPNLFMLYGPATNAHGGSWISMAETQVEYIVGLIDALVASDADAIEVRREVQDEYNRRMDDANARMVWSHPGMSTYVRNAHGRVTVNMPWRLVDYWTWLADGELDDFIPLRAGEHT